MIPVFGAAVYYLVGDNLETYLTLPLRGLETAPCRLSALSSRCCGRRRALPRLRRGRLWSARRAATQRPEDEQAGDPRRIQGNGRQPAHEAAHPPHAPRYGAPPHDAGGSHGHRRDRQSDPLRRGAEIQPSRPTARRRWWRKARTTWRCASARRRSRTRFR